MNQVPAKLTIPIFKVHFTIWHETPILLGNEQEKEDLWHRKRKKGPAPKTDKPKRKKMSTSEAVFAIVGAIIVLSMIIGMFRF